MASETLTCIEVAISATDSFEQVEMTEPRKALDAAGATTGLVSPEDGEVKAWTFTEGGDTFPVDVPLDDARPEDFDAILLLGGVLNPDTLQTLPTRRSRSPKPSSTPTSPWHRSAMVPGPSSRRGQHADGA